MFRNITPVVKNLLIINVVVFIGQLMLKSVDFTAMLSLWNIGSSHFKPYQFFTYMFAHSPSGFGHGACSSAGQRRSDSEEDGVSLSAPSGNITSAVSHMMNSG